MNGKQDFFEEYPDLLDTADDPRWHRFIQHLDAVYTTPKVPAGIQNWSPSTQLSGADLMQSSASFTQASAARWSLTQGGLHLWLVFVRQLALMRRNGTIAPTLLLLSVGLILFSIVLMQRNGHDAVLTLALVTALSAAMGIAFSSDMRRDSGLEIVLSTATSLRVILLCRYFAVIGAHMLFCGCASVIAAILLHQEISSFLQLWLVPLFFVSALTLVLVPLMGAWFSFLATAFLEVIQGLHLGPVGEMQLINHALLSQMNPFLLVSLAGVCLILGVWYSPQYLLGLQNIDEV